MHDVCVIVVSHNNRDCLAPAISSLYAHAGPIQMDVVVVDNGSDGAAEQVSSLFSPVRTIRCENRGFAHANNRALEGASARYVLFLNPDTEILSGCISDLVVALDSRPDTAVAGVRQLQPNGTLAATIRRFPAVRHTIAEAVGVEHIPGLRCFLGERELDPACYERETLCDWTSGSFMLVRASALDSVGWFDERYFLFSEETDLCRRLRGAGWTTIHIPAVTIRHDGSDGWGNADLEAQSAYARMQFARKHFSDSAQVAYRAALAFRYLSRIVVYSTRRRHQPDRRRAVEASLQAILRDRAPFQT